MTEGEVEGICDKCGKAGKVFLSTDPYLREIYPEDENEESWWCEDCYDQRREDI